MAIVSLFSPPDDSIWLLTSCCLGSSSLIYLWMEVRTKKFGYRLKTYIWAVQVMPDLSWFLLLKVTVLDWFAYLGLKWFGENQMSWKYIFFYYSELLRDILYSHETCPVLHQFLKELSTHKSGLSSLYNWLLNLYEVCSKFEFFFEVNLINFTDDCWWLG